MATNRLPAAAQWDVSSPFSLGMLSKLCRSWELGWISWTLLGVASTPSLFRCVRSFQHPPSTTWSNSPPGVVYLTAQSLSSPKCTEHRSDDMIINISHQPATLCVLVPCAFMDTVMFEHAVGYGKNCGSGKGLRSERLLFPIVSLQVSLPLPTWALKFPSRTAAPWKKWE